MDSTSIAALVAHLVFWVLLAYAWFWEEVGLPGVAAFVLLWVFGWVGLPYVPNGAALFSAYVAVLDVVLVFIVFKGDVKLT